MAKSSETAVNPPNDPLHPTLDLEMMRAQIINALLYANYLFQSNNAGLVSNLALSRVGDMWAMFTLDTSHFGSRLYLFRLVNPDGTQARLIRLNDAWEELDADNVDDALKEAIGQSLSSTVCAAYSRMVPLAAKPTHEATTTLQ